MSGKSPAWRDGTDLVLELKRIGIAERAEPGNQQLIGGVIAHTQQSGTQEKAFSDQA